MSDTTSLSIDSPDMFEAGREPLSLALIDSRNRTLHLLASFAKASGSEELRVARVADLEPPRWLAGRIAWFAEWWIARNTQRAYGLECPVRPTRLAPIEPEADAIWNPAPGEDFDMWSPDLPGIAQTRAYLLDTLEGTLELLEHAAETDAGLYFYRLALAHEDMRGEQLMVMAQTLGLALGVDPLPSSAVRDALLLPAASWELGHPEQGFVFAQESGRRRVAVPEFEIDAQPITWNQFVEFVDDGGYDREDLWQPEALGLAGSASGRTPRAPPRRADRRGASRHRRLGVATPFRPDGARCGQSECGACDVVGGGSLGALGGASAGDGGRVGDCGECRDAAGFQVGRRVRVDGRDAAAFRRICARSVECGDAFRSCADVRTRACTQGGVVRNARTHAFTEAARVCAAALRRRVLRVQDLRLVKD